MPVTAEHACAILDNNLLKCWGDNTSGKLGLGDTMERGGSSGTVGDFLEYVDLGSN